MAKVDLGQVIDTTDMIFRDYAMTNGTVQPNVDTFTVLDIYLSGYLPYSVACWNTLANDHITYTPVLGADNACLVWVKNQSQSPLQYGGYCRIGYKKKEE